MFQRFLVHFCLVLLFAFTQIDIATHEISHFSDNKTQSQETRSKQDKNSHDSQCEKCISYANAAASGLARALIFDVAHADNSFESGYQAGFQSTPHLAYSARAPPFQTKA